MSSYQRILIAVDLSEESHKVICRALRVCAGELHKIHLVHACEHPITGYGEITGKNHLTTESQIRQDLFPQLKALADEHQIPTTNLHIEFGQAAEITHQLAEKLGADLIVSGSHGKRGLSLLLGSNASEMVHGAKCDILCVRV